MQINRFQPTVVTLLRVSKVEHPISVHPIHMYTECKLSGIYLMHTGEGIQSFRRQHFFRDYLAVDQSMAADVFGVIRPQ